MFLQAKRQVQLRSCQYFIYSLFFFIVVTDYDLHQSPLRIKVLERRELSPYFPPLAAYAAPENPRFLALKTG